MSEYIERESLLMDILNAGKIGKLSCIDIIKRAKAVDVEPVIRCKDCKFYKTKFCAVDIWTIDITIYKVKPNDYCSFGEKKV